MIEPPLKELREKAQALSDLQNELKTLAVEAKKAGYTPTAIAKAVGVTRMTIYRWENEINPA